jgi:hypothetical protein
VDQTHCPGYILVLGLFLFHLFDLGGLWIQNCVRDRLEDFEMRRDLVDCLAPRWDDFGPLRQQVLLLTWC